MKNILVIHPMSFFVRLGCESDERKIAQEVQISYKIFFNSQNKSCLTDELSDTICYGEISKLIQTYIEIREFKLIEKLTYDIYNLIKNKIGSSSKIYVKVKKRYPPISNLKNGASFIISDE